MGILEEKKKRKGEEDCWLIKYGVEATESREG